MARLLRSQRNHTADDDVTSWKVEFAAFPTNKCEIDDVKSMKLDRTPPPSWSDLTTVAPPRNGSLQTKFASFCLLVIVLLQICIIGLQIRGGKRAAESCSSPKIDHSPPIRAPLLDELSTANSKAAFIDAGTTRNLDLESVTDQSEILSLTSDVATEETKPVDSTDIQRSLQEINEKITRLHDSYESIKTIIVQFRQSSLEIYNATAANSIYLVQESLTKLTEETQAAINWTAVNSADVGSCSRLIQQGNSHTSRQVSNLQESIDRWMRNHSDVNCQIPETSICATPFDIVGNGSCYLLVKSDLDWQEASAFCGQLNGYLAIVDDHEENKLITEAAVNASMDRVWIGLSCSEEQNCVLETQNWKWAQTNQQVRYSAWAEGEPNNLHSPEKCVEMRVVAYSSEANWNDVICSTTNGAVCERSQ